MELETSFFQPLVGREFTVSTETGETLARLKLEAVEPGSVRQTTRPDIRKQAFTCYFSGPVSDPRDHVGWRLIRLSYGDDPTFVMVNLEPHSLVGGVMEYQMVVG